MLQFGVLALTVLLWWRVQRDLPGRASAPPLAEWERLRQTVEQLIADLERRAVVAEQRVTAAEASLSALLETNGPLPNPSPVGTGEGQEHLLRSPFSLSALRVASAEGGEGRGEGGAPPDRFAHAEYLIAGGAADAVDIARQSGVSRGEAELLLSLRVRRV